MFHGLFHPSLLAAVLFRGLGYRHWWWLYRLWWSKLIFFELLMVAAMAALAWYAPVQMSADSRRVWRWWGQLARPGRRAVAFVFFLTLALRVAIIPVVEPHPPALHDEFSYLLMADTFAHGRVTNPTPAFWQHFETIHVMMHPTYQSMYPVAQGLVLAAGQVVAHAPWLAMWLLVAVLCASITWMLQAWMPPRWAFLGGVIAAIRLGMFSYWMNSYWGGAHAALGGALLLGALPRILRAHRLLLLPADGAAGLMTQRVGSDAFSKPRVAPTRGTVAEERHRSTVSVSEEPKNQTHGLADPAVPSNYWRRLNRSLVLNSLTLALGLAILANSRPYEGFVVALPVAAALAAWLFKRDQNKREFFGLRLGPRPGRRTVLRVLTPMLIVLMLTGAAMGYYFWRVTGSPLTMPYSVQRAQYEVVGNFIWQTPKSIPHYNNPQLRDYYASFQMEIYTNHVSLPVRWGYALLNVWAFYLGPVLTVPLLWLPWVARDRHTRFLVLVCGVMIAGIAIETWVLPHYAAPATAAFYAMFLQGLRHLRARRGRETVVASTRRLAMTRMVPVVILLMIGVRLDMALEHVDATPIWPQTWASTMVELPKRANLLSRLETMGGRHLVIVHYQPEHTVHEEWVYNGADLVNAPVVWARDLGVPEDEKLIEHYRDRQVWVIDPDRGLLWRWPTQVNQPMQW